MSKKKVKTEPLVQSGWSKYSPKKGLGSVILTITAERDEHLNQLRKCRTFLTELQHRLQALNGTYKFIEEQGETRFVSVDLTPEIGDFLLKGLEDLGMPVMHYPKRSMNNEDFFNDILVAMYNRTKQIGIQMEIGNEYKLPPFTFLVDSLPRG